MRTIDAAERRMAVADAVWRLILRDGFEAASVRNVAAEAGLSAGSVRHFFASQSQLQVFAMQALADRVRTRVEAAAERHADPRQRIAAMLAELLPVTDRSAAEFEVWLQFVLRARVDPALAAVSAATFDGVRELIGTVLSGARELGLAPGLDVPAATVRLNALLDGLTLEAIVAPHLLSREAARSALTGYLDELLGAPERLLGPAVESGAGRSTPG